MQAIDYDILIALVVTTLIILLLIAGIIIAIIFAGRQRVRQEMQFAVAQASYQQELRKVETELSEELLERFAQELHDNIGHHLTTMRLQIENKKIDDPQLVPVFQPIEASLKGAAQQIKLLSRSLNTDYVQNIGLNAAIQIEIERLQQLGRMKVYYENVGSAALNKNQELMVFRIFQEIIHNALKHSEAKNIYISTGNKNEIMKVRDDGKGFDVQATLSSTTASGLKNIMKRAMLANIECAVDSALAKGSTYTLKPADIDKQP